MKILHIHPSMAGGGIEAMICGLANIMVEKEDVSVCSIFKPKEKDVFWKKLSSKVHKLSLNKVNPGFSISEIFKVFKLIRKEKYDVVNMHGFLYYYILAIFFLHTKTKFFYTVHSDAMMENSIWDQRIFFIKKFCFRKGWVHPITISEVSKDSFTRYYGIDSKLIYNGVVKPAILKNDILKQYLKTKNTKLFLHAGRISRAKNQLVLCKVFFNLISKGHDIVLLIAGNKQDETIYASIRPYFSDRIIYLGERNDIPLLMANSEAMCLPSIWEGLPVTLLEALSVGCIPICSPVGGIINVINNGENGFLSKNSTEKEYLIAMENYLSLSNSEKESIRKNCIKTFSKYDIKNTVNNYINFYQSIS